MNSSLALMALRMYEAHCSRGSYRSDTCRGTNKQEGVVFAPGFNK